MFPWNGFFGVTLIVCSTAVAESSRLTEGLPGPGTNAPRLLVLTTGRVITGDIVDRDGGFDVFQNGAQLFIASESVWLTAENLPDAHLKMRDSLPSLTPDDHLRLAAWCVVNGLLGTARQEILDALHQDPHREDARSMLAHVMRLQQSDVPRAAGEQEESERRNRFRHWTPGRNLGGLPAEQARDFARTIQPLISNKCARCHHPDAGESFVVWSVRNGSTPERSEQNLAAILSRIDPRNAAESPLLQAVAEEHGDPPVKLFSGRSGQLQLGLLTAWVNSVARSVPQAATPPGAGTHDGLEKSSIQLIRSVETEDQVSVIAAATGVHGRPRSDVHTDAEMLQDAAHRNRHDLFDPAEFNQQFRHAPSASPANPTRSSRRN